MNKRRWGVLMLVLVLAAVAGATWRGDDFRTSRSHWRFYTDSLTVLFPDTTAGHLRAWRIYAYNVHLEAGETTGAGAPFDTIRADSSWYVSLPTGVYNFYCYTDSSTTLMVDSVGILGPTAPPSMVDPDSTYAFLGIESDTATVADSLYAAKLRALVASFWSAEVESLFTARHVDAETLHVDSALVVPPIQPGQVDDDTTWAFRMAKVDSLAGRSTGIVYANILYGATVKATSAWEGPNSCIKDHNIDWTDITFGGSDYPLPHGYLIQGDAGGFAEGYASTGEVTIHDGFGVIADGYVDEANLKRSTTYPDPSMWGGCPILSVLLDPGTGTYWYDEFFYCATAHGGWTVTLTDAGDLAGPVAGNRNGAFSLQTSDITVADNDEAYLMGPAVMALSSGKSIWCEANVMITEANTDDQNCWFGLTNQAAMANFLQDNGAGPAASYDGMGFFKVDGGTKWQFEVSNDGSQTTDTDVGTRATGTYVRLGFIVTSNTSVEYFVDGTSQGTMNTNLPDATTMKLGFGVKNGDTNEEVFTFERMRWVQLR